jgi:hypothetical protein
VRAQARSARVAYLAIYLWLRVELLSACDVFNAPYVLEIVLTRTEIWEKYLQKVFLMVMKTSAALPLHKNQLT